MKHYALREVEQALSAEKNMPAALYADAAQTAARTAKENPEYRFLLPYLEERLRHYAQTPIEAPTFQAYANWERKGERHLFDGAMYELRRRLSLMSIAALLDVKGAKEQCEDILYAFLHLPTWSLSAHYLYGGLEDYWDIPKEPFDETGHVRGIGRDRRQSLDLCSCSASFILCELSQLLEGRIEPCLLRWCREESFERVLKPFMSLAPFPHFEINPNNWSGVCMSSIGAAAIYLISDTRTLSAVLMRVLESLEVHIGGYNDDGASPEGFGYWQYGFEYFLMFADLLKKRTGGRIDLMQDEKVRRVAGFGADCCLGREMKLPFGDANVHGLYDKAVGRYVGNLGLPIPDLAEIDAKTCFDAQFEHTALMLRHLIWDMQPQTGVTAFPRSAVYPSSEYYMGFYHTPADPVYLLAKGGNNGESHNHNDVGSFVILRGNQMLAADAAGGDYCRDYFSEKRYTFFAARSISHNVPIVDGVEQEGHGRCRCTSFAVEQGEERDVITMDLSATLECAALKEYHRIITGGKRDGRITVRDVFCLSEGVRIQDRVVSLTEPVRVGEGALRIGGEQGMTLRYDAAQLDCVIETVAHRTHAGDCVYTIDLVPREERSGEIVIGMLWTTD